MGKQTLEVESHSLNKLLPPSNWLVLYLEWIEGGPFLSTEEALTNTHLFWNFFKLGSPFFALGRNS